MEAFVEAFIESFVIVGSGLAVFALLAVTGWRFFHSTAWVDDQPVGDIAEAHCPSCGLLWTDCECTVDWTRKQ